MTVKLKRSLQSVNHMSRKAEIQPQSKYIGPPSCLLCLATAHWEKWTAHQYSGYWEWSEWSQVFYSRGRTGGEESVRTEKGKSKRKRKKGNLRNQYTPLFSGSTAYHPRVLQFDFKFLFLWLFLFETLLSLEFFLTLFYTFHPLKSLFV